MVLRTPPQLIAAAAAALVALSCSGGGSTPASPVVVVPAPTPVATPVADAEPVASSCTLGAGQATASCSKGAPQLGEAIEAAIDKLIREKPAIFDLNEESAAGSRQYRVLDKQAYLDGVVANLQTANLCAERSLDREGVVAKSSNAFSEEWDILTSKGFIRRGGYSYLQSCQPASFPVDAADLISFVWVGIFAFECNPGVTPPPSEEKRIPLGCDVYITATPKLLNRLDVPSWIHGSDVTWWVRDGEQLISVEDDWRYGNEFNRLLRPKGTGYFSICATVQDKRGCFNANIVP